MRETTGHLVRIWVRNTVIIAVAGVVVGAMAGLHYVRLVLVLAVLAELWSTTTVVRSWLFWAEYRWFWWWRR